jgi:hypothetical protein
MGQEAGNAKLELFPEHHLVAAKLLVRDRHDGAFNQPLQNGPRLPVHVQQARGPLLDVAADLLARWQLPVDRARLGWASSSGTRVMTADSKAPAERAT